MSLLGLLGLFAPAAHAQWITQTNLLKAGWNAVYLHVDPSHTNIRGLVGLTDPIEQIFLWNSDLPPGQSVAVPQGPAGSQWTTWTNLNAAGSVLQTLRGNSALLVKVADNVTTPFVWKVKGRPVMPVYRWTLSGLNFVGFPTTEAPPGPPTFLNFLGKDAQSLDWAQGAQIFRYQGGELGNTNPIQLTLDSRDTNRVSRSQAYWIRTGEPTNQFYNQYFGPFQVSGGSAAGIHFGDSQGQSRFYLKNFSRETHTVTLQLVPSETPPTGPVLQTVPLLVRGAINRTNLTYEFTDLTTASNTWTLAPRGEPGSETEVIVGLDRSRMTGGPGDEHSGVLRFTDSFGMTRVDVGVTAVTPSRAGLWVGNAVVDQVSQYLKKYVRATNVVDFHARLNGLGRSTGATTNTYATNIDGTRYELDLETGRVLVSGGPGNAKGHYLQDGDVQTGPERVARQFPLRLIVHHDGSVARLMQRAYIGKGANSNLVVATREENLLATDLANARRVSAVHLPTSDGLGPWPFDQPMIEGGTCATTISVAFGDHASNPFLHTFHPDHDNKDDRDDEFETTAASGTESYDIRRQIRLQFTAPGSGFDNRTRAGAKLIGNYFETVYFRKSGVVLKQFDVLGSFHLTRVNDIATLASQ